MCFRYQEGDRGMNKGGDNPLAEDPLVATYPYQGQWESASSLLVHIVGEETQLQ